KRMINPILRPKRSPETSFRRFPRSQIWQLTGLVDLALFFGGCATIDPRVPKIRDIAVQTFGTDDDLRIHEVLYTGPLSSALDNVLGSSSDELALASEIARAQSQKVDLVVWSNSSRAAASTLRRALRL